MAAGNDLMKIVQGFHKDEWFNIIKMYGSKPITFGRRVFIEFYSFSHEPEYAWSNGQSDWELGAGNRAHEMTARQIHRRGLYEYAARHKDRVFKRALFIYQGQDQIRMIDGFLKAGLQKRRDWGDVWVEAPLCLGLIMGELLGPSATALFLEFSGHTDESARVESEVPLRSMLRAMFEPQKHSISHWMGVFGFTSVVCVAELQKVALRRVQVEKLGGRMGDNRKWHRPLQLWMLECPHLTVIMKKEILCLKIHQMFLENQFSKIEAALEDATKRLENQHK